MRKLKTREHWLSLNGFPNYEVSNYGKIRSIERVQKINGYERLLISKELSINVCNRGWCNVMLSVEGKGHSRRVHRLVAEHFLPRKKDKLKVLHVDGDRRNNHVDNLRWVSYIGKDYYVC